MAKTYPQQIAELASEVARLQDLLDRRPAINAGLIEAYMRWTRECYESDIAAAGRLESEVH